MQTLSLAPEFWRNKTLAELNQEEWEALCDGCGRCCLHKLEDEDTGEIAYTRVVCHLLDLATCRCSRYAERTRWVLDCLDLRKDFQQFHWLPATCAYRLLAEGKNLPVWHPLLTGTAESVHSAGKSVRHFAVSEREVEDLDDMEEYVIDDPD